MGAAEAHRDAAVGGWKAVALPSSAAVGCLRGGGGRTGAGGGPPRGASRSSGPRPVAQLVSTKALGEVPTRMTTGRGAPQVGPRAARSGGGVRGGGWPSLEWTGPLLRRLGASGRAQLAGSTPTWRPCLQPSGTPCGRNRRSNSMTSRGAGRRRALPTVREVNETVRSVRLTRWWLAMATWKTAGAREVKAAWPWDWPGCGRSTGWSRPGGRWTPAIRLGASLRERGRGREGRGL